MLLQVAFSFAISDNYGIYPSDGIVANYQTKDVFVGMNHRIQGVDNKKGVAVRYSQNRHRGLFLQYQLKLITIPSIFHLSTFIHEQILLNYFTSHND